MKAFWKKKAGFTLVELLTALLILSILALTSYRGLGAVLDAREHVASESSKWRGLSTFFSRFERDIQLAMPRSVRSAEGQLPAWIGRTGSPDEPILEFSRSGSASGLDGVRRTGYRLSEKGEVELWVWAGPDPSSASAPGRYVVLENVAVLELQYLTADSVWVDAWPPGTRGDAGIPRAVRVKIALQSKEEIVRIFALGS